MDTELVKLIKNNKIDEFIKVIDNDNNLINFKDEKLNQNLLFTAIYHKRNEIAEYLIDKGIDINEKNSMGWNCLHKAAIVDNLEMFKLLLKKGMNINDQTDSGFTSVMLVGLTDSISVAEYLNNDDHINLKLDIYNNEGKTIHDMLLPIKTHKIFKSKPIILPEPENLKSENLEDPILYEDVKVGDIYVYGIHPLLNKPYFIFKQETINIMIDKGFRDSNEYDVFNPILNRLEPISSFLFCKRGT
jgi:hypothetical protein